MKYIKIIMEKVLYKLSIVIPLKNYIIFESYPDLSGNTYPLFEMMLKNNINKEYKLVWFVTDKNNFTNINIENVEFININPKKLYEKIKKFIFCMTAKCIICENRIIRKINKKQMVIYLSHGTMIKNVRGNIKIGNKCDFVVYASEYVKQLTSIMFQVNENKLICLGYPRNDYLFKKNDYVKKVYPEYEFDKVIVWMPTFRQHKDKIRKDSRHTFNLGIPILYDVNHIREINDYLKRNRILLVIKPHPAQDLSLIKAETLSNFVILYDEDLMTSNVHLYEFLSNTDALITDYSSVYFDYLLTNKPIGLTVDDIEDYGNTIGFAFENIFEILKGKYINNINDMKDFISDLVNGVDNEKLDREKINNLMNSYKDDKATKRVYDFIFRNANL